MLHPTTARKLLPHESRIKELTPRVRLAARLYATGIAKTKRQAAEMVGLSPSVFYLISTTEVKVSDYITQIDKELENEQINMGKLIQRLGRRSIRNIAQIAEKEDNPVAVRLKAAQDLADRSPETSKVLNINATIAAPLSDAQIEMMRQTLLEAQGIRERYADAADGNYVTATDEATHRSLELVSENAPKSLPAGSSEEAA